MSDADRLTALETHLTHLERQIEELDQVVRDQAGRIERLEKRLRLAVEHILQLEAAQPQGQEKPPPHY